MNLFEFTLLAIGSLFVIVDPIGTVPSFLAMTAHQTSQEKYRIARLACFITCLLLILFCLLGKWIFLMLGITLPAFQIAGGLVLLLIAYDMLRAQRSPVYETAEETAAGSSKTDIAITPLAIPMLAGPGAISTAILLQDQTKTISDRVALYGSILGVCLISYSIFYLAIRGVQFFGPITLKIMSRLMGLFLAAVSVQFMINGLNRLTAPALP